MIKKMLTGVHHWQFGVAAIAVGIWLEQWRLVALGVYLVADDTYQHWRQKREYIDPWPGTGARYVYHSPVHRSYVWAFGWLHQRVVQWWRER